MRVAGYPRVSTNEQADDGYSIEEQIDSIQKWCKDRGYTPAVIEPYVDDGYSAKDLKRPGITKLIDDVKAKKYDMVVTTKLNRLSRKLLDILDVLDLMEKNGCSYISVQESFDTSTYIGRMQMQMLGVIAEFDRERIAEDVRNTMKSIARKSGTTKKAFTSPCYGYDVVDGKYQINPEEAKAVKLMAEWALAGTGHRSIAAALNHPPYSIKSRTGKAWSQVVVRDLLRRPTLKGHLVYNRTYKKNRTVHVRPEEEWIIIEDHHEPILTEEVWDEIQKIMDGRKTMNRHAENDRWLLSGLLICSHCGYRMKGKHQSKFLKRTKETTHYYRYICGSYDSGGTCFNHYILRDDIESFIINQIKDLAASPKADKLKLVINTPPKVNDDKDRILAQFKKLDQKMQKQIEAYEDDLISADDLKKARARIDEQRTLISAELDKLAQQDSDSFGAAKANENARKHLDGVMSEDRLVVKHAIRQVIHSIEITDGEEIKIIYHSQ